MGMVTQEAHFRQRVLNYAVQECQAQVTHSSSESSQGKGGDLRSKYDPTLTAEREKYNRDRLPGTLCRAALITTLRLGTAQVLGQETSFQGMS